MFSLPAKPALTWTPTRWNLRRSRERSQLLLQSSVAGALYSLDPAGHIETWNASAERLKGYAEAEIAGQHFACLFTPEDRAKGEPARLIAIARETGRLDTKAWRVRKDGSRFLAHIAMDAIRNPNGMLHGFAVATRDITEQERAAAQQAETQARERQDAAAANAVLDRLAHSLAEARDRAEQANQAKTRFLAAVTHELRTPLHGILGYAELLSLEGGLTPTQLHRLEVMMASGQHLLGLINAVLDMSQIETGQLDLQPVEVQLLGLLRVCVDVVRPSAEAKGLAVKLAPPPPDTPVTILADPTRLRQVLFNLLGNAVKFTPAGSIELRVRPAEDGARIRLEVADTGPGIRQQHRDKLFQTFERLNAEAVNGIEGAGLGLAIAARLVQLMDGQIGLDDNEGGGSVFWIELPVRSGGQAPHEQAAALPCPSPGPRLRVLVADDELLNRSIAEGFLTAVGHQVVCVDNGAAAVEAVAADGFDAVLMDVRMPGMNGMEATRRIRTLPAPRGTVRIVAVTAHAFARQIDMCRQAGMDAHVSKPFKQAMLLAALQAPSGPVVHAEPAEAADDIAVFDRATFHDNTEFLPAATVAGHLETLNARCEVLLHALLAPELPERAAELTAEVHSLAGVAGTLGFLSVSAAARHLEYALAANAPEIAARAIQCAAALETAAPRIRQELAACAA